VLETLRHGAPSSGPGAAELLSVAVGAPWRGTGVGAELVRGFLAELERRGAPMARVVLGADNTAAEELYRRAGFRTARTFEMHRGTTSLVMERAVAGGGAARPAPEH